MVDWAVRQHIFVEECYIENSSIVGVHCAFHCELSNHCREVISQHNSYVGENMVQKWFCVEFEEATSSKNCFNY